MVFEGNGDAAFGGEIGDPHGVVEDRLDLFLVGLDPVLIAGPDSDSWCPQSFGCVENIAECLPLGLAHSNLVLGAVAGDFEPCIAGHSPHLCRFPGVTGGT